MKILVLLADGFEEMEAVISVDMLRRAGLEVITASIDNTKIVCGSRNIKIKADKKLPDFKGVPDVLVLPGGKWGVRNLAASKKVRSLIKSCYSRGKIIAAICAAPGVVLGPLGVLDGRKVTGYPDTRNSFGDRVNYLDEKVVVDGKVITSRGVGTAFDFTLKIIETLKNKETAEKVKKDALL